MTTLAHDQRSLARRPLTLRLRMAVALTALCASASARPGGEVPADGINEIVSRAHDGSLGSGRSNASSLSADGRWVAFYSFAQLLPGDTNSWPDVYAYDRLADTLVGVSTPTGGGAFGDGSSWYPSISADGRYVAFESGAGNLAPLDLNGFPDIYVKDLQTDVTFRVSNSAMTGEAANWASRRPSISGDGRYVAFRSLSTDLGVVDTNTAYDIYRFDTLTGDMIRVSNGPGGEADGSSHCPSISADGSRIAFQSWAGNLIPDDTNGQSDVFVVDIGGLPTLVSRTPAGAVGDSESFEPKLSADGGRIAFTSRASDLTGPFGDEELDVFVADVDTLQVELVSVTPEGVPAGGNSHDPSISADGRYVAFSSATNGLAPFESRHFDVFVRDVDAGITWTAGRPDGVTVTSDAGTGSPALSADGRTISFTGVATNLVPGLLDDNEEWDIYVREMFPQALPQQQLSNSNPLQDGTQRVQSTRANALRR